MLLPEVPSAVIRFALCCGVPGGMEHDANGAVFAELFKGGKSGADAQWTPAEPIERALGNR